MTIFNHLVNYITICKIIELKDHEVGPSSQSMTW